MQQRILPGRGNGGTRRVFGHVHVRLPRRQDVTAFNAGALTDPDIAGIHALLEIEIGNDACRQVTAGADD